MTRAPGVEALTAAERAGRARTSLAALAAVCLLLAAGCNKAPAESALAEADQALAVARPELERYAPEALAAITRDDRDARARMARGDYTEALRIAQRLPTRIADAAAIADRNRRALLPIWAQRAGAVPAELEACGARIEGIEASQRLPRGLDPGAMDAVKADLVALRAGWVRAEASFRSGDLPAAIRTAKDVQAKAAALSSRLAPKAPTPRPEPGPEERAVPPGMETP